MERKVHPNARITLMAFIGDRQCDSFSEGAEAYKRGHRDAVEHADDLATHGTWTTARSRDGRLYTHIGVMVFGRDDEQPDRVIHRARIERASAGLSTPYEGPDRTDPGYWLDNF